MNSKQKGNIGIGLAISYFCGEGYTVSIPLNDSQDYDLVVDIDGCLNKVQVKYTAQKAPSGNFVVSLRSISGTTKEAYKTVKDTDIDYLFIVDSSRSIYLLPIIDISSNSSITITDIFSQRYKLQTVG